MLRIKGFDKDLKCREMQFEIGKEYKINSDKLELCTDTVFHYCKTLKQVNAFYKATENNRYCYIEVLGDEVEDVDKCGSNHIKIIREIVGEELDILLGRVYGNTGVFNAGDCNSGHFNAGDCNAGDKNTGNFNSCNYSSGFFCTKEPKINIFNKKSKYTMREFMQTEYYHALFSSPFGLTEEKDGELVKYSYEETCSKWWAQMSKENREIIKSIPNFDVKIFEEITGIKEDK